MKEQDGAQRVRAREHTGASGMGFRATPYIFLSFEFEAHVKMRNPRL